jgi:hypothetical protein
MRRHICNAIPTILLALSAHADHSTDLARALAFSREFMFQHHFVAKVDLQSRDPGGLKEQFTYDRYPEVERIKLTNSGVFAQKQGGNWLKSNDWGQTGTATSSKEAADLDYRTQIAQIAWNTNRTSYDKTQGDDMTKLVAQTKSQNGEHFVFERTRGNPTALTYPRYEFTKYSNMQGGEPLLEQFSGPIVMGAQKMFVTVRYTALIELKDARVKVMKAPSNDR